MKKFLVILMGSACLATAVLSSCKPDDEGDKKPAAAGIISGADANTLPDLTVELSIEPVEHADSYQWYKDNVAIEDAIDLTYTVTESGIYSVEGVNAFGVGERSPDKEVTITIPLPDDAGTISGEEANILPDITVELSIEAIQYATSYQWYQDDVAIDGADGLTYTVTETGTYKVEGVNVTGAGNPSPNKTVTITIPAPGDAGTISGPEINTLPSLTVELSVEPVLYATSYQWYKGTDAIEGATGLTYTVAEAGMYSVEGVNQHGAGTRSPSKKVIIAEVALPNINVIAHADYSAMYKFNMNDPTNITKLEAYAKIVQSLSYINGIVYGITYSSGNNLISVDPSNGVVTELFLKTGCDGTGMAYNSKDGKVYVSTYDKKFGTMDLSTGVFTAIVTGLGTASCIAIDNDGICYLQTHANASTNKFCTVNLSTGELTTIVERDFKADGMQNLSIDPATNKLYWIHRGGTFPTLYEVNKTNGNLTKLYEIPDVKLGPFTILP